MASPSLLQQDSTPFPSSGATSSEALSQSPSASTAGGEVSRMSGAKSLSSLGLTNSPSSEGGSSFCKDIIDGGLEVPNIPRSRPLMFRGNNVTKFLEAYELEFSLRGHGGPGMAELLPLYVRPSYFRIIREMPGSATREWDLLKKSMKEAFFDEELYKYGLDDLRAFVRGQKQKGWPTTLSQISRLYFRFLEISSYLKRNQVIGVQEETRYFLKLLSADLVDELYERRERRQQVREEHLGVEEERLEEEELTVKLIMTELRFIFVGRAKHGKASQLRRQLTFNSSESDSDSTLDADTDDADLATTDEESRAYQAKFKPSKDTNSMSECDQKKWRGKKEKSGGSEGLSDLSGLLVGFQELQAGLLKLLSERSESEQILPPATAQTGLEAPQESRTRTRLFSLDTTKIGNRAAGQ
ncbi:hypothetical protein P7C70_g7486, partial [Phenoliferia sp. Uapishka_3]